MNDSLAETIFVAARQFPGAEERARYLQEACGANEPLRKQVERMLTAEQKADRFLANNPLEWDECPSDNDVSGQEGAVVGCYKLLQQIGEGGCGIVYMAEQERPIHRRVALKLIKPGMDTRQVIARFEAERQALALMDHPNIARVFDAGSTDKGRPYFVMELVRGMKITEYCDQNSLPMRERLELFMKVAQAVQHAHQKGIIHRDLKPSNVLVTLHDGVPVPKVIDFGVAKAMDQKLTEKTLFTQFEQFIGTPAYTSPEQAEMSGLDIDTRSDIYSLGVLLYELLVGSTPFDSKDLLQSGLNEMRRIIREQEPDRPSTRLSTLHGDVRTATAQRRAASAPELIHLLKGDLDWIVMKCLEKDRTRRYDSTSGLSADIGHYLSNEAVTARPPSAAYRLGKLIRRNKAVFTAGIAVAVALVAGIVASTWQATRARRAERAAKEEKDSADAVLKFFREKLLAVARPDGIEGGQGRNVTLRQAIDSAESQIAEAFKDRPLVEASIRHTIGESYEYLGESTLAVRQLERALVLRRQKLGPRHPSTLWSMCILANAYWGAGQSDLALRLDQQTFELRKAALGPRHPDTLASMSNLGDAYIRANKLDKALPILEEVLEAEKAVKGPEDLDTLTSMANLARVHEAAGKLDRALPLFEAAGERLRAKWPNHLNTLNTMANLAHAYWAAGKAAQGLPLIKEAFHQAKERLGPDHPQTIGLMQGVAFALLQQGRDSEADELLENVLLELHGKPGSALVFWVRGELRTERHRISEAIADFTKAIQAKPNALSSRSRGILRASRLGKFEEAALDFAQAIQLEPANHESYHFLTACLVQGGDIEAYRAHCRKIAERFAETEDPAVAHRMAKDCSILPDSGIDRTVLDRWIAKTAGVSETDWAFYWFIAGRATLDYREGRYASAAEAMEKVLEKTGHERERDVEAWAVLAMARHQLHEYDHARSALARAIEGAAAKLPKRESGDLGPGHAFVDWAFAHALIREARTLIEQNANVGEFQ